MRDGRRTLWDGRRDRERWDIGLVKEEFMRKFGIKLRYVLTPTCLR